MCGRRLEEQQQQNSARKNWACWQADYKGGDVLWLGKRVRGQYLVYTNKHKEGIQDKKERRKDID